MATSAELRSQLESLREQREVVRLQQQLRVEELASRMPLLEAWGDPVNRREFLNDTPGWGVGNDPRTSMPADRRNGDNSPHWSTETEHATIRGICRFIADTDEVAIGGLENLRNYTVGAGLAFKVTPRDKHGADVARICQEVLDRFTECNRWEGEGDRDCVTRERRDGELLVTLAYRGGIDVEARFCCPSFLTEPDDKRSLEDYLGLPGLDWKYGVATDQNNPTRVHGFFVQWCGDDHDWEFVTPDRCVWSKLNTDREVKRGASDLYAVYTNLERASKLLGNTLQGAAIQAAIAYIREHAAGTTGTQIESWVSGHARQTTPGLNGEATRRARQIRPGQVVDIPSGAKFFAGPMGSGAQKLGYVDIMQAALRVVGIRWTMPEYMISGDASNANFSSTLVAESPFTRASEARQGHTVRQQQELAWKVIGLVANAGRIRGFTPSQLKQLVTVNVDAPTIAVRNKLEDAQVSQIAYDAGFLALDTWATESGYNLADERAKGAKPQPKAPPPMPPATNPEPVRESVQGRLQQAASLLWQSYP